MVKVLLALSCLFMIGSPLSRPTSFYIVKDGATALYIPKEESAQEEYSPLLLNLTLDMQSCSNGWCVDTKFGTPRYIGKPKTASPTDSIQRYTHKGFEKCFGDKVVVVIGDSRLRYQFLNLAAFSKYQKFMKCQDYADSDAENMDESCFLIDRESPLKTQESLDWTSWYQETTLALQDGSKQQSLCDCFRRNPFLARKVYENRFVERKTDFGNIHFVYLQTFANLVRIDHKFPPYTASYAAAPNDDSRCKVGECGVGNRINAFEGTVAETIWEVLPKLNTTHAFVSMGWEDNWERISDFACIIRDFQLSYPNIRVFLIINPPIRANLTRDFDDLKCKVEIYDRDTMSKNVPTNWYWDGIHASSILNEEYNHRMIQKVCPMN